MPSTSSQDLTKGPIGKTLLLFSLPILGGYVLQSLNGSINAIWIGRYLGEAALAGATNANNVLFTLMELVFGVGMAAKILVAQSVGARDLAQAKRVIGCSATLFCAASIVIAAVGWLQSTRILVWLDTPAAALPLAEAYLRVIFLAIPLIYLFSFVTSVLRGAGDARTPFYFLLLVALLDTILNPLFIFGWGPVPRMGISGSATATLFAQGIGFAALLAWLRWRRHPFWIGMNELHLFRPDARLMRALISKGLPLGLQMLVMSMALLMMMGLVNRHGLELSSGYGAALQLWNYVQMPALALGSACAAMAAQNVGAGLWQRVDATARAGLLCNALMTGVLILAAVVWDRQVLSLFLPPDSAALNMARHLNHIAVGSFMLFGVTFVISGVMRSTGAVIAPLVILCISLWGVRLPVAEGLQRTWGVDAIWWSFPISAACAMFMSLAYYRWGGWRQARMMAS